MDNEIELNNYTVYIYLYSLVIIYYNEDRGPELITTSLRKIAIKQTQEFNFSPNGSRNLI